jgi:hypothetical protein
MTRVLGSKIHFQELVRASKVLHQLAVGRKLDVRDDEGIRNLAETFLSGFIMSHLPGTPERGDNLAVLEDTMWRVMWPLCGFPSLIVKPKRAAYFASTNVRVECATLLEPPWPAFYVHLPDCPWVTTIHGREVRFSGLMVRSYRALPGDGEHMKHKFAVGDRLWSFIGLTETADACLFRSAFTFNFNSSEVDPWDWDSIPTLHKPDDHDILMYQVITQFIAGIALEFQAFPESMEQAHKRSGSKAHRETVRPLALHIPRNSLYVLGEDVIVDAREAISGFLLGKGKSPGVRSYIRPYPRIQHHGPKNSLSRLQRIEGHWRGAVGAPISIRNHKWAGDEPR